MSYIEKEKLIKADIASIENRVRHAFNQGYELGLKDGKERAKPLEQETCEDCISRQAVLDAIDAKAWEFCDYLISEGRNDEQKPVSHFADNLREFISEELPPVTSQPNTGHWIKTPKAVMGEGYMWYCDNCEYQVYQDSSEPYPSEKYCPDCGYRMIKPQESEVKK